MLIEMELWSRTVAGNGLSFLNIYIHVTLQAPTPENGQTHSKKLLAVADNLLERVWPFCGVCT